MKRSCRSSSCSGRGPQTMASDGSSLSYATKIIINESWRLVEARLERLEATTAIARDRER